MPPRHCNQQHHGTTSNTPPHPSLSTKQAPLRTAETVNPKIIKHCLHWWQRQRLRPRSHTGNTEQRPGHQRQQRRYNDPEFSCLYVCTCICLCLCVVSAVSVCVCASVLHCAVFCALFRRSRETFGRCVTVLLLCVCVFSVWSQRECVAMSRQPPARRYSRLQLNRQPSEAIVRTAADAVKPLKPSLTIPFVV